MTEIFDIIMMVGDLVLILALFYFIAEVGLFFLDEFSGASARIIQEFVSGGLSMANFAPDVFSSEDVFPAVNHMMKVSEDLPFIFIKTGSRGTSSSNPISGEPTSVMLTFVQKPPLSFFIGNGIALIGDCMDNFCAFSGESRNKIKISKNSGTAALLLNRDSAATGSLYKLGKKIFSGECNSKMYSVDYLYAGTDSISVQVKENEQILYEPPYKNPTWEVKKGTPVAINGVKITLYDLDTKTNMASITVECS